MKEAPARSFAGARRGWLKSLIRSCWGTKHPPAGNEILHSGDWLEELLRGVENDRRLMIKEPQEIPVALSGIRFLHSLLPSGT